MKIFFRHPETNELISFGDHEMIAVALTEEDKAKIGKMVDDAVIFAQAPEDADDEEFDAFATECRDVIGSEG